VNILQDVSHPKGFDMKNRPKARILPVDYHLHRKQGIEKQDYKDEVLV
jgi:hypothetical protein